MSAEDELDLEDDGFVPATNPTKEDYDAVVGRNRRLFARAKKAEAKKAPAAETVTPPTAAPAAPVEDAAWKEKMELRTEGYSDAEIDYIQTSGGRKALESPYTKAAIKTMRDEAAATTAAVETTAGKSDVEKTHTDEQLRSMSADQLAAILPKAQ